ncbi:MAG: DUF1003 domain-containing protein [Candidatus Aenigmarchaeota archaeon]|nr:DUF1003 domain-containing protein [Candidatus Aenigmarchaeota archaeon]
MNNKKLPKEKIEKLKEKQEEEAKVIAQIIRKPKTLGQKSADWMTKWVGSWTFIILLAVYITIWITGNVFGFLYQWDPWPFIILNLTLSCLAAVQAPIILMSQNRQELRDRCKAEIDFRVNKKAELEIEDMQKDLEEIKRMIKEIGENKK